MNNSKIQNDHINEQTIVHRVRDILSREEVRSMHFAFNSFPAGACADASILLAIILKKYNFGEYQICYGKKGDMTHAWLSSTGRFIDITIGQFTEEEKINECIFMVEPETQIHYGYSIMYRETLDEAKAGINYLEFFKILNYVENVKNEDFSSCE
ncbi:MULTISPECIES: hypothetical protein [Sphingobacterium]|uniref:hypothetical protein n=1 Tax=Sphingobacterium TaxID=28453 RepID=UPI00038A2E87|nr:hypothetical protein [Sphingobacterium sp. IITKGP-BTPF85]KKX47494.1 hypothetical protein L950_0226215 [Sphingobacterium sp. IITKGP-BTPF85]